MGQYDIRFFERTDTYFKHHNYYVKDMHTNNNLIAIACSDRKVRIHRNKDLKLINEFEGNSNEIRRVKFSPDGIYIFVIGDDPFIRMYNQYAQTLDMQFKGC